jgi:hypothetical protein
MVTYLSIMFGHLLTWLADAAGAVYAWMVLTRYLTDGPRYRLDLELRHPAKSVFHLVVWLGVKVLQACLWLATAILNMLLEASAEVGEWFIRPRPAAQESIDSRFLV